MSELTYGPPGLVAAGDRLVLTFGDGSGSVTSMVSWDGVQWYAKNTLSAYPRTIGGVTGGVQMTYSAPCGSTYVSWRDRNFNLWAARSWEGMYWAGPYWLGQGETAPALKGDDPNLGIGFAVSQPQGRLHYVYKGRVDCDLSSNYSYPIQPCFFSTCYLSQWQHEPMPVAWTGGAGIELSALSQGPDTNNQAFQLRAEVTGRLPNIAGNNWSNNGVAGTVSPYDGNAWVAWTCHDGGGDTCSPDLYANAKINIHNVWWGGQVACPNWSVVNPSTTYWQGMLWIAWAQHQQAGPRGPSLPFIHVASVHPF